MVAMERSGALDRPDEQPEAVAKIADVIMREEEMPARARALEKSRALFVGRGSIKLIKCPISQFKLTR